MPTTRLSYTSFTPCTPIHRNDYVNSLYMTIVLGAINFTGYVIITTFLGITEIPIIIAGESHVVTRSYT